MYNDGTQARSSTNNNRGAGRNIQKIVNWESTLDKITKLEEPWEALKQ